jgi:hypothetical protein
VIRSWSNDHEKLDCDPDAADAKRGMGSGKA